MAAPKTTKVAKPTPGHRSLKPGEPHFANYAEKDVPPVIQEFVDWLKKETGAKIDAKSVYLGSALRGTFQKSDENQKRIAARKKELEQERLDAEKRREERAAAKVERDAAKAARAAEPKVAKTPAKSTAKSTSKTTAERKAPATKASAKKPAAKAAPATATRRRPAKAKAGDDSDF
jgi:hypothetical protein